MRKIIFSTLLFAGICIGGCAQARPMPLHVAFAQHVSHPMPVLMAVEMGSFDMKDAPQTDTSDKLVTVLASVERITGPWIAPVAGVAEPCELTLRITRGSVPNHPDTETLVISFWQGDAVAQQLRSVKKWALLFNADGSLESMGAQVAG